MKNSSKEQFKFNSSNDSVIVQKLKPIDGMNLAIIKTTPTNAQLKAYKFKIKTLDPDLVGFDYYLNDDFIKSDYSDESTYSILNKYGLLPKSFYYLYSLDTNQSVIEEPFTEILNIDIEEGLISVSCFNGLYCELYNLEGKLIDTGKYLKLGKDGLYHLEPIGCSFDVVNKHIKGKSINLFITDVFDDIEAILKTVHYDYLFDDLKIEDALVA